MREWDSKTHTNMKKELEREVLNDTQFFPSSLVIYPLHTSSMPTYTASFCGWDVLHVDIVFSTVISLSLPSFPSFPSPLSLSFSALCLVHVARCPLKQHVHYTLLFKRKDRYMKGLEVISRAPGVQRILSLLINIAILLAREHRYHKFSFSTPEKNEDFFFLVA